ncbi:hypothetical protein Btru_000429 [Bulinus truncatus]|nr:hypothetical protein Btru_000429 [Bulinus truncatus]
MQTSDLLANQANKTTKELNEEILNITISLSSTLASDKPAYSGDILQTINVLGDITKVVLQNNLSVDDTTLTKFVSVSNYLLLADGKPWSDLTSQRQNAPSTLVYVMDVLVTSTLSSVNNDSQILQDTIAIVRGVSSGGITFPKSYLQKNKEDWTQNSGNKIFLSKEAFSGSAKYSVITYKNALEKFQNNPTLQNVSNEIKNFSFASEILTLSVLSNETLKQDLKLQFQVKNVSDAQVPNCGFLDTSVSQIGQWSTKGCTVEFFENNTVNCSCNHLTNFAILMSPYQVQAQSMVLSLISTIGCAISIFCLTITIIVYLIAWRHVKK